MDFFINILNMAPRGKKVNDISKSKLLVGFKLQETRSTADTDGYEKSEVICLSDKAVTLKLVKFSIPRPLIRKFLL